MEFNMKIKKSLRTILFLSATSTACLLVASGHAADQNEKQEMPPASDQSLTQDYKGNEKIPDALLKVYSDFVKAAKQPHSDFLNIMLPHSVSITYEERPAKTRGYGQDLNLPFLQKQFQPKIWVVRKDSADCYLLRTGSSALWFVETKSQGWRLYRYLDKPIE
jgi:hypothetical protein